MPLPYLQEAFTIGNAFQKMKRDLEKSKDPKARTVLANVDEMSKNLTLFNPEKPTVNRPKLTNDPRIQANVQQVQPTLSTFNGFGRAPGTYGFLGGVDLRPKMGPEFRDIWYPGKKMLSPVEQQKAKLIEEHKRNFRQTYISAPSSEQKTYNQIISEIGVDQYGKNRQGAEDYYKQQQQEQEESLLAAQERKEQWVRKKLDSDITLMYKPRKKPLTPRPMYGPVQYSDLKYQFPEAVKKAENEYESNRRVSGFLGAVVQAFDKDITERIGGDEERARREVAQATLHFLDPKKMLSGLTLDIIDGEDLANLGQSVYTKGGKLYYKGFEIGDEYLTTAAQNVQEAGDMASRFLGAAPTYFAGAGLIETGIGVLAKTASTSKVAQGFSKLAKGILWAQKKAPILTELTAFNLMEETAEAIIRKTAGQEYTFNDFVNSLKWGAALGGSIQVVGKVISAVQARKLVQQMENQLSTNRVIDSFDSLRELDFEGRKLDAWYRDTRFAYLKEPGEGRPGIEKPAPLPQTDLQQSISKAKASGQSFDEWVKGQGEQSYRSAHQVNSKTTSPITKIADGTLNSFVDEFKRQYGYPALKSKEVNKLKSIISNPEADIKIYRASPKNELNDGDWVTIDKDYANDIKRQNGGKVYEHTVKAEDLFYPKTIEGFKELPSLNKWGAFQYQSSKTRSQLKAEWDKVSTKEKFREGGLPEEARTRAEIESIRAETRVEARKGKAGAKLDKKAKPKGEVKSITQRVKENVDLMSPLKAVSERIKKTKDITEDDFIELAKKIENKNATEKEFYEASIEVAMMREIVESNPVRELSKYESRTTGELAEVTGKGKGDFARMGDQKMQELGFKDSEEAREAYQRYLVQKDKLARLQDKLKEVRKERGAIAKGEALMAIAVDSRRKKLAAIKDHYNLTDFELSKLRQGKDLTAMTKEEYATFLRDVDSKAADISITRDAKNQVQAFIREREFIKWENLQEAMKLPPIEEMTVKQLQQLEDALKPYAKGDEFLPVRMLETIKNTDLKGVKTNREVIEILAKKTGKPLSEMNIIEMGEFDGFRGDYALSKQNPFFDLLVRRKVEGFLEADARAYELIDKNNALVRKARASVQRGVLDKLIPEDPQIKEWIENVDNRAELGKKMTPEQLDAASYQDSVYRAYYDEMVIDAAGKKFSRFEDKYFPHIRKDFLENWKDDGLIKAFKETRKEFEDNKAVKNILNNQTGEILPYEKWIPFEQKRTGKLVPTENTAKAFSVYVKTLERARYLDSLVPEIMAYVHVLSPKGLTPRGLELDSQLKEFVKKWINTNKGRVPTLAFEPGGVVDSTIRAGVVVTRTLDLAWNFPTQVISPIGEHMMTLTMLKKTDYAKAVARRASKQGQKIVSTYENFVGRSFWKDLTDPSENLGSQLRNTMFPLYHLATKSANEIFLLGKMTAEEFKTGKITTKRLADIQLEMAEYRQVRGMESIIGKTGEAQAFKQYKGWAIPVATATIRNAKDLYKLTAKATKAGGVKYGFVTAAQSKEAGKLFFSIASGLTIYALTSEYYEELGKKKNRSFAENVIYKGIRDSLTLFGAFDPTLWVKTRVGDFALDVAVMLKQALTMERYAESGKYEGGLKAPESAKRIFTPASVKPLLPGKKEPYEAASEYINVLTKEELSELNAELDEAVAEGKLTEKQADTKWDNMKKNQQIAKKIKQFKDEGLSKEEVKERATKAYLEERINKTTAEKLIKGY